MHIKLDAVGGCAGDMFNAALLHAFPHLAKGAMEAATALAGVGCRVCDHNDGVLAGQRFCVELPRSVARQANEAANPPPPHQHTHGAGHHGHAHAHDLHAYQPAQHTHDDPAPASPAHAGEHEHGEHRHWSAIRTLLENGRLAAAARSHAVAIFSHLAEAEARVHGIAVEDVAFHEVGASDSIADIVAAATIVAELEAAHGSVTWEVGSLPLGSGRVATAHGLLPIPAPATALLLHGFAVVDDGIAGERVTPTGAAILRHLCRDAGQNPSRPMARVLGRSGIGFGTRKLPGLSNCLRALVFDEEGAGAPHAQQHRELAVVEFEVDDQSAEDLAIGLDRLRAHPDVFDVVQMPAFGKKGRMMTHVRLLARATARPAVIEACFKETTTIGLRHHLVSGDALPRRMATVDSGGHSLRVKIVDRPGERTAKAEADDSLAHESHARRAGLRRDAERSALKGDDAS